MFSRKWCYSCSFRCLPGLHTLVRFSENTDHWICFCYCTQGHVQGSGHRVGAGAGSALGALGVPTHPVGRSSGILQGLVDRFPDEVLKRSAGTVFLECALVVSSASFTFFFLPSVMKGGLSALGAAGEVDFSSCDPHNWDRQASPHCSPPPLGTGCHQRADSSVPCSSVLVM